MSDARVAGILAELGAPSADGRELPQRLVDACAAALPVSGVGLAVMGDDGPTAIMATTNGAARVIEELQFTLGEGPCVDSAALGRPVLHPDLRRTGPKRWPGFSAGALEAGVAAVFAFPLRVGGIRLGILDLYRDTPGDLDDAQMADALAFADASTTVLLDLQAAGGGEGLAAMVEDRAEVHQATGMVSVQAKTGLSEALMLLRARAYATDRPILDLARDVIARRVRFEPENGHHE